MPDDQPTQPSARELQPATPRPYEPADARDSIYGQPQARGRRMGERPAIVTALAAVAVALGTWSLVQTAMFMTWLSQRGVGFADVLAGNATRMVAAVALIVGGVLLWRGITRVPLIAAGVLSLVLEALALASATSLGLNLALDHVLVGALVPALLVVGCLLPASRDWARGRRG